MVSPYARLLLAQARSQAQYRGSFVTELVGSLAFGIMDLVAVFVVFRVAHSLGGFDFAAAFVMGALSGLAFSIADLFVSGVERLRFHVRTGGFDAYLVRPLGALGQLAAFDFAPRRAGRVVATGVMLVIALSRADIDWTPARVLLVMIAPLSGAVLFGSVFVATATLAFWWVDAGEVASAFTYGGRDFTAYPMSVYGPFFRAVFAFGLGFGFVGYYPALVLLDRADPLGLPGFAGWLSPLVALAWAAAAGAAWRLGVRRYRSTGS